MRLNSVQILRAIAANLVVLNHIWEIEHKFHPDHQILPALFERFGIWGVQMFFVISGFVIILAAQRETARVFILSRVTRIYPIYWFYTSVLLVGYLAAPQILADRSGTSLIASYLLWPTGNYPLLVVGWTLIHEMYFYLVIAAMLVVRAPPAVVLAVWAVIIAAAQLWAAPASPVMAVVPHPLTLLFILGAAGGLAARPVTSNRVRVPGPIENLLVLLGNASYSTYLAHVMVISAIWRVGAALPVQLPQLALVAISFVAANLAGVISYFVLERPTLTLVRRWARPAAVAA
ncbi:MAG: acyltransferase family protein [Tardiphaga sp.]